MQTAIYKRREIVELAKRFDATGEMPVEIQKRDIYEAMVKGAAKIRAPGESEAQAFSRYITSWADGASLFRLHKNASGSDVPPTPTFTSSFEALEHEKAQARKNTEAANRDRARRVESTIQEQIGALMLAGMSEAAARAHVERSPKIRAMRSASNIYRT